VLLHFAADIAYLNSTIADFKILFFGAFLIFDFVQLLPGEVFFTLEFPGSLRKSGLMNFLFYQFYRRGYFPDHGLWLLIFSKA